MDLVETVKYGETVSLSHLRCDKPAKILRFRLDPNGNRNNIISLLTTAAAK